MLYLFFSRSVPPPDKDLVRLFIRAYAVRAVSNPASPWVVDDVMVMKHALSSRLCDLSISPITVPLMFICMISSTFGLYALLFLNRALSVC